MPNLKRILVCVFLLLMILLVLVFVLENQQSVSLLFLGFSGPQLPVSVVAMLAMLIGMLIGPVMCWFLGRSSRAARKRMI
ncbi:MULTISPECIES: LapA family protein [unclassified Pseudomonas]|uniref:LapA family protein n=1 Tax=unclassified Pseudomonas TaxID=196821 RepID=UPI001F5AB5A3|nr:MULTISPECIES: LapA family protein [unclassified Pseudomonas]